LKGEVGNDEMEVEMEDGSEEVLSRASLPWV
jgi:hypothetical protein